MEKEEPRIPGGIVRIYKALLLMVLIGQFTDWIFDYNDETKQILNVSLFSLVGVAYIIFAWAMDKLLLKTIMLCCGIYIIVANFLDLFNFFWILSIASLITPMIIGRFFLKEEDKEGVVD